MARDELVQRFSELDTATVSDALDRLGIAGQVPGIYPVDFRFRTCGRAHTLQYEPVDDRGGTVGDFIDEIDPSKVIVIANAGRSDCTVWGDILTSVAARRGVQGTVIDGVCRDVAHSVKIDYPVFSRGRWMRTGKDRVRLSAQELPVELNGVGVDPGDVVLGDADGVVVIPAAAATEVLEAATEIGAAEEWIRMATEGGLALVDARRDAGYHSLQTRSSAFPR